MSTVNLGRVRGTMWYVGVTITGTSTSGAVFPNSGISAAYEGDMFLNIGYTANMGNIYRCSSAGDASTAVWKYIGCLKTPLDLVNNLTSTSTTKGLTANQGRVLRELIEGVGIFPLYVLPSTDDTAYTASVTVKNDDGTITVTTADEETGEYTFTAGTGDTKTVTFSIDSSIGLSGTGAVITRIDSTVPIYEYHLYDSDNDEIAGGIPNLWETVLGAEDNVQAGTAITDGSETVKSGILSKLITGVRNVLWPITHAKAVWYDKANNKTVHDVIGTTDMGTTAESITGAIAEQGGLISTLTSGKEDLVEYSQAARTGGYTAYWKFSGGTLICAKTVTASVACNQTWGSLYYSNQVSLGNWAVSFTGTPYCIVTAHGSDTIPMTQKSVSATSAGTIGFVRPVSTTASVTIHVIAIGRWK